MIESTAATLPLFLLRAGACAFAALLCSACGGAPCYAGPEITRQGSLVETGVATHLALQGPGFFVLRDAPAGRVALLTRAGNFLSDAEGYLATPAGLRVQGYVADPPGNGQDALGSIQIGAVHSPARATTTVSIAANLKADSPVPGTPFDSANPGATSNFSTSATVYDSAGLAHDVQVYFLKTADSTWDWHSLTDGTGVKGGTPGTPVEIASGTLEFDPGGALWASTQTSSFNPVGTNGAQPLSFYLGDAKSLPDGGSGLLAVTSLSGQPSQTHFVFQDGCGTGWLASFAVGPGGGVTGTFTNGAERSLGVVAVALVRDPARLELLGGQLLAQTDQSGAALPGAAWADGRGETVSRTLELLPGPDASCSSGAESR